MNAAALSEIGPPEVHGPCRESPVALFKQRQSPIFWRLIGDRPCQRVVARFVGGSLGRLRGFSDVPVELPIKQRKVPQV